MADNKQADTKQADTGEQYWAAFDRGEAQPWGLFKTSGSDIWRFIPHRGDWVPMKSEAWDWVAIGMSSDANGTRPISAEQATGYQDGVRDLNEQTVAELESSASSPAGEPAAPEPATATKTTMVTAKKTVPPPTKK